MHRELLSVLRHAARLDALAEIAIADLGVHAYAGMPLAYAGQTIGALCIVDSAPRVWCAEQLDILRTLGASAKAERAALRSASCRSRRRCSEDPPTSLPAASEAARPSGR